MAHKLASFLRVLLVLYRSPNQLISLSLSLSVYFIIMYMLCVHVCLCAQLHGCPQRADKGVRTLQLQVVPGVSRPTWVLRTEL